MTSIRRALCAGLAVVSTAAVAPVALAESSHETRQDQLIHQDQASIRNAAKTYHETRQDSLIHTLQAGAKSLSSAISGINATTAKLTTELGSVLTLLPKLTAITQPVYGIAKAAIAQSGGQPAYLPSLYTAPIPRDGIDPAVITGDIVVVCQTAPCSVSLIGAVRSSRPTPTGAAGEIGGGVIVHDNSGAVTVAGNISGDGKHPPSYQVPLRNVAQLPVSSSGSATSSLTPVPFVAGGIGTVNSDGTLSIPTAGTYTLTGTFYFYDLDNQVGVSRDRAHALPDKRS